MGRPPRPRPGAELLAERLALVEDAAALRRQGLRDRRPRRDAATTPSIDYKPSFELPDGRGPTRADARPRRCSPRSSAAATTSSTAASRWSGPHRDELLLTLGDGDAARLPVKGYASHGESWSFALALRLASYDLLRADGDDPILILDDVFAELDTERRAQLADLVAGAEQVLVTAAVAADVPEALAGRALPGRGRGGAP